MFSVTLSRGVSWPSGLRRWSIGTTKNLHGFELTLSRFLEIIFLSIVQQKVVNVADKAIKYCLQADNKSHYIC